MAKPLDQFGGWLKFFYIANWVNIGIIAVSVPLLAFGMAVSKGTFDYGDLAITLIGSLIELIFLINIVRIIKIKNPVTPSNIVRFLSFIVILTIVISFVEFFYYYVVKGKEGLSGFDDSGRILLQTVMWFICWTGYFNKSERVRFYYKQQRDILR